MIRFFTAVGFVGCLALPLSAAPVPKDPILNPEVVKAWERRGATIRKCTSDWSNYLKKSNEPRFEVSFLDFTGTLEELPPLNVSYELQFWGRELPKNWVDDLPDPKNLIALWLGGFPLEKDAVKSLKRLPALAFIYFCNMTISDENMADLKELPALKSLFINTGVAISATGYEHLGELKKLELLNLQSKINDADFGALKGLKALQILYINNSNLTAANLENLKGLRELRDLSLWSDKVTIKDEGLEHLRNLNNLRMLILGYAEITDDGLAHLKNMTQLESLNISNSNLHRNITDNGLLHLKDHRFLKCIYVHSSKISDLGLQFLENFKRLEDCRITHSDATEEGLKTLEEVLSTRKVKPSKE